MQRLSINLLGPFQVMLDGNPLTGFETSKTRALLAYLAVEHDRAHAREQLAELLWPDRPPGAALANLRHTLASLRKVINDASADPPFLLVSRESLQLNPAADVTVDLATLDQLDETRQSADRDATALYRGLFLDGFALNDCPEFEAWMVLQREQTSRRIMCTLAHLVSDAVANEELDKAIEWTEHQMVLDPWNEVLFQQSMWLLARSGQRAAALRQFEVCRRMVTDEYAAELQPDTVDLAKRIRAGDDDLGEIRGQDGVPLLLAAPITPASERSNLPNMPGVFLGRAKEMGQIEAALANPACRLLTVVGVGGSGKSRLAIEAASEFGSRFAQGLCFVPLTAVVRGELLASAILRELGAPEASPLDPLQQLAIHLRDREMLLVLDNFEQLVEAGGQLIRLLDHAPRLKLLVTSRERLNLAAEWLLPLEGLELPDARFPASGEFTDAATLQRSRCTPVDAAQFSGVQLFIYAVQRLQPDFELNAENEEIVIQLCRLLGGLPLAIELAAAWTRVLALPDMVTELTRGIDLLSTNQRDVPDRHRNMRVAFDHSWQLLQSREQRVLRHLSVFRGGCTREAAEAVAGATLADLSMLLDCSWLRLRHDGRYVMHELVRQYCAARLEATAEEERAYQRHCDYYGDYMDRNRQAINFEEEPMRIADAEFGNLQVVYHWAINHDRMDIALNAVMLFWFYCEQSARLRYGIQLFQICTDQVTTVVAEGREEDAVSQSAAILVTWLAIAIQSFYEQLGLPQRAIDHIQAAHALLEGLAPSTERDELMTILTIPQVHIHYRHRGRYAEASERYRRLLRQFESATWEYTPFGYVRGKAFWCGNMHVNLARCAWSQGHYDDALANLSAANAIKKDAGEKRGSAGMSRRLARYCTTIGETAWAEPLASNALILYQQIGNLYGIATTHLDSATALVLLDRLPEARSQLQLSLAAGRRSGIFDLTIRSLVSLAHLEIAAGDVKSASAYATEAIETWSSLPGSPTLHLAGAWLMLGWAALTRQEGQKAKSAFLTTLRLEDCSVADAMDARLGLAELAAATGRRARATTLLTAVLHSPATAFTTRTRAEELCRRLALPVFTPPDVEQQIEATRASARQLAQQILDDVG